MFERVRASLPVRTCPVRIPAPLAHFGDAKAACAILDKLLATQGTGANISRDSLRLEPTWDPIRHDPAFQTLLKKYVGSQASQAAAATIGAVPHTH